MVCSAIHPKGRPVKAKRRKRRESEPTAAGDWNKVRTRIVRGFLPGRENLAKWQSMKPRIQFRLRISKGDDIAVGPGKIDLLEAIRATGSITAAARSLGMSYRRAWLLVDTMNRCFRSAVVAAESGGRCGGGTQLTALGEELVRRYRRVEAAATRASKADLIALTRMLAR